MTSCHQCPVVLIYSENITMEFTWNGYNQSYNMKYKSEVLAWPHLRINNCSTKSAPCRLVPRPYSTPGVPAAAVLVYVVSVCDYKEVQIWVFFILVVEAHPSQYLNMDAYMFKGHAAWDLIALLRPKGNISIWYFDEGFDFGLILLGMLFTLCLHL